VRVCVLASGSAGNSTYVEAAGTRVLVDAGLTGRKIEERMAAIGVDPSALNGLVVSHEHGDHVKGVGVMARRYRIPVWMTNGTLGGSKRYLRGKEQVCVFENDESFHVGELHFQPFQLSHDAADPVNFVVEGDGSTFGIATDMGVVTELVYLRLRGASLVLLESNYDHEMLMNGPYPWDLKRRISSNRGHLENDRASEAVCRLAEAGLERAVLGHLSERNNTPDLAIGRCREALAKQGAADTVVSVASQDRPGDVHVI
jgi:phosphoribosyl 1,2-cyclic phosphodiesterase